MIDCEWARGISSFPRLCLHPPTRAEQGGCRFPQKSHEAQSGAAREHSRHICGLMVGEVSLRLALTGLRLATLEWNPNKACRSLRPSDVRSSRCGTYELEPTFLAKTDKRGPNKLSQTINLRARALAGAKETGKPRTPIAQASHSPAAPPRPATIRNNA